MIAGMMKFVDRFYIEKTLKNEKRTQFSTDFLSGRIAGGIAPEERARFGS